MKIPCVALVTMVSALATAACVTNDDGEMNLASNVGGVERASDDVLALGEAARDLCTSLDAALVARRHRCYFGEPRLTPPGARPDTILGCEAFARAVTSGDVRIDRSRLAACAASIDGETCANDGQWTYDPTGPCADIVVPARAELPCVVDWECGAREFCDGGRLMCRLGVCRPRLAPGADCPRNEGCEHGTFCAARLDSPAHAICRPYPGVGALLAIGRIGEACAAPPGLGCEPAAYCDANDRCVPKLPIGAACPRAEGRAKPCRDGFCSSHGVCEPLRLPGQPCEERSQCVHGLQCTERTCRVSCPPLASDSPR